MGFLDYYLLGNNLLIKYEITERYAIWMLKSELQVYYFDARTLSFTSRKQQHQIHVGGFQCL